MRNLGHSIIVPSSGLDLTLEFVAPMAFTSAELATIPFKARGLFDEHLATSNLAMLKVIVPGGLNSNQRGERPLFEYMGMTGKAAGKNRSRLMFHSPSLLSHAASESEGKARHVPFDVQLRAAFGLDDEMLARKLAIVLVRASFLGMMDLVSAIKVLLDSTSKEKAAIITQHFDAVTALPLPVIAVPVRAEGESLPDVPTRPVNDA